MLGLTLHALLVLSELQVLSSRPFTLFLRSLFLQCFSGLFIGVPESSKIIIQYYSPSYQVYALGSDSEGAPPKPPIAFFKATERSEGYMHCGRVRRLAPDWSEVRCPII